MNLTDTLARWVRLVLHPPRYHEAERKVEEVEAQSHAIRERLDAIAHHADPLEALMRELGRHRRRH